MEEINFIWEIKFSKWDKTIIELKEYKKKYGNLLLNTESSIFNKIRSLRNFYRLGNLSQEKIDLLENIGFIWNEKEYIWDLNYEKLKNFANHHGSLKDINNYHPELSLWINGQKKKNSSYKMSEERKSRLNEIKGWCL